MKCLKCGRETKGREVFCPACLKVMAASPVKPGTTVTLPRRDKTEKKAQSRKQIKPEVQISRLRKTIRRLRIAVTVLGILLIIAGAALTYRLLQPDSAPSLGQNYSTAISDTTQTGPG